MKRGDLVFLGFGALGTVLGGERLREDFDENGYGGLFVPQIKILVTKEDDRRPRIYKLGQSRWIDRKRVGRCKEWK